jgi:hypothetical protein
LHVKQAPHRQNDPNKVDYALAGRLHNIVHRDEGIAFPINSFIIFHFCYASSSVKYQAKVVFDIAESLISNLDTAITHQIDVSFLYQRFKLVCSIFEESGLHLRPVIIHEVDIEKVSFTPRIFPTLTLILSRASHLNPPVVIERGQRFNRRIRAVYLEV